MQLSSGRHGRPALVAPAPAQRTCLVFGYRLPFRRDLRLSRPHDRRMVVEPAESASGYNGSPAGKRLGYSPSDRPYALLPTKKSRAADGCPGKLRHLVYGTETRAVAYTQEPEKAGAAPAAYRKVAA